jgi:thiosulfate/3-mercaptopyruvate sulfurtransferase
MAKLISAAELAQALALEDEHRPLVFECRNTFVGDSEAQAGYTAGHIPSAALLEGGVALAEPDAPYANTRPVDAATLGESLGGLGIASADDFIVLYGRGPSEGESLGARVASGMMWATRCWWVLKSWGFTRVAILDGGIERWTGDGQDVMIGPQAHPATAFDISSLQDNAAMAASKEVVLERVSAIEAGDDSVVLLDSLPTSSYDGTGRTTAGRRSGHITGAVSLPYPSLFDGDTGLFLPASKLLSAFADVGISHGVPILAY